MPVLARTDVFANLPSLYRSRETLFGQKKICIVPGKYSLYGSRKNCQRNLQKISSAFIKINPCSTILKSKLIPIDFFSLSREFSIALRRGKRRMNCTSQFLKISLKTCFNFLFSSNLSSHNYVFQLC